MQNIKIEFFHDVVCSFCFPMSYRMRKLQEEIKDIEIVHRSFALVKSESDFDQMFGSREAAKDEILTHWVHANENHDLHCFNIEGMKKTDFLFPSSMNPLKACKAAYFLGGNEKYWDLFDELQKSLFVENKNIELEEEIYNCVKNTQLDFEKWSELYTSDKVQNGVEDDLALAKKYGIYSVPTLVIDEKYILQGAVKLEVIKNSIYEIRQKKGM